MTVRGPVLQNKQPNGVLTVLVEVEMQVKLQRVGG